MTTWTHEWVLRLRVFSEWGTSRASLVLPSRSRRHHRTGIRSVGAEFNQPKVCRAVHK